MPVGNKVNAVKYRDADRLVEHIEAGMKTYEDRDKTLQWDELSNRGDSFHEFPTYIKHWESAKPWGWEIRILTESGLHTFHLKWKDYKRPRELTKQERCPHN